uniref:uncharacterized protein LOC124052207 isoform X2 n=1 Tax=Scatophagus argus TaxID=75038 RepID=UPI001ED7DE35|nr:uncharacterized protein LOC124052207 isoform X2 [Scatophagus argus]
MYSQFHFSFRCSSWDNDNMRLHYYSAVDSQPANVTEPGPSEAEANQTSTESNAGNNTHDDVIRYSTHQEITSNNFSHAAPPGNETSRLYNHEKSQPEELQSNQTSFIPEDDENFQKQETEFPFRHCDQDMLVIYSHSICGAAFHAEMQSISSENWCVLENIIRPYNDMTHCVEKVSYVSSCYYPNPNVQEFFLDIHSIYFHNCSSEALLLVDAPRRTVIALTVIPVSFIPLLVYLVISNSKGQKS